MMIVSKSFANCMLAQKAEIENVSTNKKVLTKQLLSKNQVSEILNHFPTDQIKDNCTLCTEYGEQLS